MKAADVVMVVVGVRVERGQPLQPHAEVVVQARLIVVDEDTRGDAHGIIQPFLGFS